MLEFYGAEIEQLSKLLPESSPIRDFYRDRESQRADKLREQEIYARINEFWETQDYDSAIEFVAKALDEETNADLRWHLEMQRVSFLVSAKKHEETLQHIARLLEADDVSDGNRSSLVSSELHSLTALNKTDEAIARLNAHLEAAANQPKLRQELLEMKASWFDQRNQRPEATAAWSAYREEFAPNTFGRLAGSMYLGRSLQKENKHREAISLFEEYLAALTLAEQGKIELNWPMSYRRRGFPLLSIAESQLALGAETAASQRLDEVAANIAELAASPLNGERETAESMRKQEQDLRTRLAEAEQPASE